VTSYLKRLKVPHPVMGTDEDRSRVCLVCHAPVAYGDGVALGHLRALAHHARCYTVVTAQERDYARSAHGRWNPPAVVFNRSNGRLCVQCSEAP
jgi:hypothetical protein